VDEFTELSDRVLRFDGVSILEPEQLQDFLMRGVQPAELRVTELTPEVEQFNALVSQFDRISDGLNETVVYDLTWQLPEPYLSLDVVEHVQVVFGERLPGLAYNSAQTELAITRVARELEEFETRGLNELLRTIIYVLARFKETGQVFGVGRGSSCASFILFLLGLHVVDPIKFDVPLEEFMH
jgi:DNA polymerase III alpha subunit